MVTRESVHIVEVDVSCWVSGTTCLIVYMMVCPRPYRWTTGRIGRVKPPVLSRVLYDVPAGDERRSDVGPMDMNNEIAAPK